MMAVEQDFTIYFSHFQLHFRDGIHHHKDMKEEASASTLLP